MKKVFIMLSCLFSLQAWTVSAQNRLYIEDFSIDPGATVDVSIMLDNEVTDFASFQADLYLSEGLELVQQYNEEDEEYFFFSLTSRKKSRMAIGAATQSDGSMRMMLTQTMGSSMQTISGTSGALVTFKIKAAENASGTKYIDLKNVVFTTASAQQYNFSDERTTVTITGSSGPDNPSTGNRLYIEDFGIDSGATVDVSIMLDNEVTDFASFQADLYLSEGLELVQQYNEEDEEYFFFSLTSRKKSRMAIGAATQSDGSMRMMLTQTMGSSMQTISGTSGALVTFKIKAADNANGTKYIDLKNVVFTTVSAQQYNFSDERTTVTISSAAPSQGLVISTNAINLIMDTSQSQDITDRYITNPQPNQSNPAGWIVLDDQGNPTQIGSSSDNIGEFWNNAGYSIHYTIKNLPKGVYLLSVEGWTRTGMVSTLKVGEAEMNLVTIGSDDVDQRSTGRWWIDEEKEPRLVNDITWIQEKEGDVEISITADVTSGDHWTCWGFFKLYDCGSNMNSFMRATLVASPSTTAVTWTSSNTAVAQVSSTGVVTAVAPGTATISCTSNGVTSTPLTVNVLLHGDVNGDKSISIADVTSLVNIILR